MSWHFNPMSRGDLNVDPIEQEFFATETLGGITEALVREAIQNSLDAAAEQKIKVRFYLGQAEDAARERYLDALWPHVEAARGASAALPGSKDPLRFLAVEDEGTRGLEGDPGQYEDDAAGGSRNDFYYFWRNVGRSRKEAADRGRWGLGKAVFAAASRLNVFFGLTKRRSDPRTLLMGQAVLSIHQLADCRYKPYGYYGSHENDFTIPFDDSEKCREFARSFGLRRQGAGLSIVVPYPDEQITADSLLQSVLRHYFYPVLEGRLEVKIEEEGSAPFVLRENGLEGEVCRKDHLRHLLPLIELARWGLDPEEAAVAALNAPNPERAPKFTGDLFDPDDLERLRRRYDEGGRIALDVRVWIQPQRDAPRETRCRLLMERDTQDQRGEGYFVREGITIENPKARRPRGVRWILVVSDPNLSAFLGDAENPAHTEWQRSSPKFKEKYRLGPSTLDFVRSVPANLASILSQPAGGRDPDLLRNIFSLADDAAVPSPQVPKPTQNGREESTAEESVPGILGKNGTLVLKKVRTGFRLSGRADDEAPRRLEVLVAYDVLRGNPFRRYSPLDFCMDKSIAIRVVRGARVLSRQKNRLEIEIEAPVFEILVTRFDENRDLRVRVRPLEKAR